MRASGATCRVAAAAAVLPRRRPAVRRPRLRPPCCRGWAPARCFKGHASLFPGLVSLPLSRCCNQKGFFIFVHYCLKPCFGSSSLLMWIRIRICIRLSLRCGSGSGSGSVFGTGSWIRLLLSTRVVETKRAFLFYLITIHNQFEIFNFDFTYCV